MNISKHYFLTILIVLSGICPEKAGAQILSNGAAINGVGTENPFLDASTYFDYNSDPSSTGKGMVFPRTDLTQWSFKTGSLDGATFPSAFDGMIIYNFATGNTPTTGSNPSKSIYVTPGFYYFSNPSGVNDISITNGQWIRMNDNLSTSMPQGTSLPSTTQPVPNIGDVFYLIGTGLQVFNGTTWVSIQGSLSGDVSGTLAASSVDKLQGTPLSIGVLASGDILKYNGTNWVNWGPNYLTLSSVSAGAPLTYNSTTGAFGITQATTSTNGYLSSIDWNAFNNKQVTISLTTAGTSGNATFSGSTLNIPNYTYTLPNATGSALGGVIVGSGLNVTAGGTISTVNNGSVTNFSANDLNPLFTTTEATTTTTPALSFTLTNAGANTIFGNNTAAATAPTYFAASSLPIAGDVSATLGASTVDKLKGTALSISSLASGNLLRYDGTNWANWIPNYLTLTSVSAGAPLTYNSTTGAFGITQATTSTNGYLSSTDWNVFNNKVTFPGFGLTTGKVWGYDSHPTTLAGYGITDAAPISGGANYIQNQNSVAQTANMRISGTVAASQFDGSGAGLTGTASSLTAGTANNLTNSATGIYSSTTGTAYSAAVCVREASLLGGGDGTSAYAPRLGFHWGGRVASSISIESDGHFYFNNNPGTGREDIYVGKINADGAATNKVAYNAGAGATINFSLSNIAYTSATATAITLSGIKDGGAYTLIFTSTAATGTVAFTATGFSFVYMGTAARTSGKTHIYSLIVAGTVAYVTMAVSN